MASFNASRLRTRNRAHGGSQLTSLEKGYHVCPVTAQWLYRRKRRCLWSYLTPRADREDELLTQWRFGGRSKRRTSSRPNKTSPDGLSTIQISISGDRKESVFHIGITETRPGWARLSAHSGAALKSARSVWLELDCGTYRSWDVLRRRCFPARINGLLV